MTNPLLKAAGITPDTPGHSAERALFEAAWECVQELHYPMLPQARICWQRRCCDVPMGTSHTADCPLAAFDEAAKIFQEDV